MPDTEPMTLLNPQLSRGRGDEVLRAFVFWDVTCLTRRPQDTDPRGPQAVPSGPTLPPKREHADQGHVRTGVRRWLHSSTSQAFDVTSPREGFH